MCVAEESVANIPKGVGEGGGGMYNETVLCSRGQEMRRQHIQQGLVKVELGIKRVNVHGLRRTVV